MIIYYISDQVQILDKNRVLLYICRICKFFEDILNKCWKNDVQFSISALLLYKFHLQQSSFAITFIFFQIENTNQHWFVIKSQKTEASIQIVPQNTSKLQQTINQNDDKNWIKQKAKITPEKSMKNDFMTCWWKSVEKSLHNFFCLFKINVPNGRKRTPLSHQITHQNSEYTCMMRWVLLNIFS